MTRLLLTRHGHVQGIKPARFRGRAELPLTPTGLAQAERLGLRIARQWKPAAVYTSGLQRCIVTGSRIGAATGAPCSVAGGLMDIDYGTWQLRTHDEVRAEAPAAFALWHNAPQLMRFPKGESLQDLVSRAADALRAVLSRHPNDAVVMVGHDSVNRALLLQLCDQPLASYWKLAQDPCCLNEVVIEGDRVQVLRVNDTSHLA
jgi:probable phosphoglycerate mutase